MPVQPCLQQNAGRIQFALALVPFSAIAFLWFMGVIRSHLGSLEDQFFSTVFFGSGILFLAIELVTAAVAGALLASFATGLEKLVNSGVYIVFRLTLFALVNTFMIRMEGVFMISLGNIWMRTRVMPLWLAVVTYLIAIILLLTISVNPWLSLLFPGWVLLISLYILLLNLRRPVAPANLITEEG